MKVAYVGGVHSQLDAKRGIGANTEELVKALGKRIEIEKNPKNADIIHFTKFNPFFIALPFIKPKNQKWVLTIHDLIPLIYSKYHQPGVKGSLKFFINKLLIKKYIDKIITISETSKKDICRFFRVNPDMVEVIYLAPKSAIKKLNSGQWEVDIKRKFNLPNKFVLFDHGTNYNKNLITLVKACLKIGVNLVAVDQETKRLKYDGLESFKINTGPKDFIRNLLGLPHPEVAHLKELEKLVKSELVITPGYVTDDELNALFNLAQVCVQPSFYEGFGMPVIEAMAVGTPVVASKTQALMEIAEESALFCNPNDVDDMAEKIKKMLSDEKLRREYVLKGYENVKKFSWKKAAEQTFDVYKNL